MKEFLEKNCSDQQLSRTLFYACEQGNTEIVQLSLDLGRGIDLLGDSKGLLLGLAVWREDLSMVKLLLNLPEIESNQKNQDDRIALSLASQKKHYLIVKTFLTLRDLNVNTQDENENTSLIWAAYYDHSKSIQALLRNPNIDSNIKNNYRDVALNYAIRYDYIKVFQMLLTYPYININTKSVTLNSQIHETILFASIKAEEKVRHNECLKLLLEKEDLDVNITKATGDTILFIAVERGFDDQVAIVLSKKDLNKHHFNVKT